MKRFRNKRGARGFTLVEVMIVVAIISLLVAIAIPNLLRARVNANEAAALGSLRTLVTALESFRAAQTPPTYPGNLATLGPALSNPPYIDARLAGGTKQGYTYTFNRANANEYTVTGRPQSAATGRRIFFVDEEGVIKLNNAAGPPIE